LASGSLRFRGDYSHICIWDLVQQPPSAGDAFTGFKDPSYLYYSSGVEVSGRHEKAGHSVLLPSR
jgi:hypothetical protein